MRADRIPDVKRYPTGRRKYEQRRRSAKEARPQIEIEADLSAREIADNQSVALHQPHRHGDADQLLENPLGRFVRKYKLKRAIYDAGISYKAMRIEWLRAFYTRGLMLEKISDPIPSKGGISPGPKWKTIREWRAELDRIEKAIRANRMGWRCACQLILEAKDVPIAYESATKDALIDLAKEIGTIGGRDHPFA